MRFFRRFTACLARAGCTTTGPPAQSDVTSPQITSVLISNFYDALFPFTGYNSEQTLKLDKPT